MGPKTQRSLGSQQVERSAAAAQRTEAELVRPPSGFQRAQHPLIKQYTLNYKGFHIMI